MKTQGPASPPEPPRPSKRHEGAPAPDGSRKRGGRGSRRRRLPEQAQVAHAAPAEPHQDDGQAGRSDVHHQNQRPPTIPTRSGDAAAGARATPSAAGLRAPTGGNGQHGNGAQHAQPHRPPYQENGHHGNGEAYPPILRMDGRPIEQGDANRVAPAASGDGAGPRAEASADRLDGDPLRVDVQTARRQSSARRRPTAEVAARLDPEQHGIQADDPTGGAFDATLSMTGRTPPPTPPATAKTPAASQTAPAAAPQRVARGPEAIPVAPTPAAPMRVAPRPAPAAAAPALSGEPQVLGRAVDRAAPPRPLPSSPPANRPAPMNKHVCPFCGTKREHVHGECPGCGLQDNEETRAATAARVGPWFVLQARNPSAPGMRFSVLRELVRSGQVTAGSIVRGPTSQQLWTYAARVRGLAYLFGICWSCNRRLPSQPAGDDPDDFCIYCGALQEAPTNPDQQLGALETGEAFGTSVSDLAGQVPHGRPGANRPRASIGAHAAGMGANLQVRESPQLPPPRLSRRPMPRPIPPSPSDGGDALLTTRELATAFNLDRRRSGLSSVPWGKLIMTVVVLVIAAAAFWFAASVFSDPIEEMLSPAPARTPPADTATP